MATSTKPNYSRFEQRNAKIADLKTQLQLHNNIIQEHKEQMKTIQAEIDKYKEHKLINHGLVENCVICGPNCILDATTSTSTNN